MKIVKTRPVKTPTRGTYTSAGLDFYVPDDYPTRKIFPGESKLIPSGIHAKIPKGFALIAMNKSGVSINKNLVIGACVVDEDYQGEIHLHLINTGKEETVIHPGEKIAQFLLIPVDYQGIEEVESLDRLYEGKKTQRGTGWRGSTGTR